MTDFIDDKQQETLQQSDSYLTNNLEPQLLAKLPNLEKAERIAGLEAKLSQTRRELAFALGQTVFDVAGVIDPTPVSDGISAAMSLSKGDYVGAALSTVGMIPYIGDALGKPIKEVRNFEKIAKLEQKINNLVRELKELSPEKVTSAARKLDEAVLRGRAVLLERLDKGHSLARHSPELTDDELIRRIKEGVAPDGKFSPVPKSNPSATRFSSYEDWLHVRDKATEQITKRAPYHGGIDLTKPPLQGSKEARDGITQIVEFDRPIGEGFKGVKGTEKAITAPNGRKETVYSDVEKVEGLTRVKVDFKWNDGAKRWEPTQYFPSAKDFDPLTREYITTPDIKTKLPSILEKKASLELPLQQDEIQQLDNSTQIAQANDVDSQPNQGQTIEQVPFDRTQQRLTKIAQSPIRDLALGQLFTVKQIVNQWQKESPKPPEVSSADLSKQISVLYQQQVKLTELLPQQERTLKNIEFQVKLRGTSLTNPFIGVEHSKFSDARDDVYRTKSQLEQGKEKIAELEKQYPEAQAQEITYQAWKEHPQTQTMEVLTQKLKQPEVQQQFQQVAQAQNQQRALSPERG